MLYWISEIGYIRRIFISRMISNCNSSSSGDIN